MTGEMVSIPVRIHKHKCNVLMRHLMVTLSLRMWAVPSNQAALSISSANSGQTGLFSTDFRIIISGIGSKQKFLSKTLEVCSLENYMKPTLNISEFKPKQRKFQFIICQMEILIKSKQ